MSTPQTLRKLLSLCAKHGYNAVAIGMRNKAVPQSLTFPFALDRSIFAKPKVRCKAEIDRWPAIWTIVKKIGLEYGCGNFHQSQIHNLPFHPQVWQLKKGKWIKIAEELPDVDGLRKRINLSIAKAMFKALPKAERDKRANEAFKIIKKLIK